MPIVQRDLSPKRARIFSKINDSQHATTTPVDTTPCPENFGIHQIEYSYWGKRDSEICQCINCPWNFIKYQQPMIPSGLIEVLKR